MADLVKEFYNYHESNMLHHFHLIRFPRLSG